MRCSYWLGRYVGMCPGAYSDPQKRSMCPIRGGSRISWMAELIEGYPVSYRRLREPRLMGRGLLCTGKAGPMIYARDRHRQKRPRRRAIDERGDASKPMRFATSAGGFDRCIAYLEGLAESKIRHCSWAWRRPATTGCRSSCRLCRMQGYAVVVEPHADRCDAALQRKLAREDRRRRPRVLVAETLRCGGSAEQAGDEGDRVELRQLTRRTRRSKESVGRPAPGYRGARPVFPSTTPSSPTPSARARRRSSRCPTPEECLAVRADSLPRPSTGKSRKLLAARRRTR